MNPILRNFLAVIAGLVVGSIVNMGIVIAGIQIIPPPADVDIYNPESLKAGMHLFESKHFIMPFLAHAIGTLAGALVAAKIAVGNKMRAAFIIGVLFLLGGIMNIASMPSPMWFTLLDLLVAYLPMAYLGGKFGSKK